MLVALVFPFLACLSVVDGNNEFLNPPPAGVDVAINATVPVKWRCDDCGATPITLNIWQNRGDGGWAQEKLLDNAQNSGSFSWRAHTLEELTIADGFHFELVFGKQNFDSGALFIRETLTSSTSATPKPSLSPSTTSMSSMTTSPASIIPSTTLTSPPSSTAPANSSNNGDQALKVGLGVGIGIGVPFLLLVGGIVGYTMFRKRAGDHGPTYQQATMQDALEKQSQSYSYEVAEVMPGELSELRADAYVQELHHNTRPNELP